MAVKFLTEEWASAITEALGASDDFKKAATGQQAKLQQVVTDVPDSGEVKYYLDLADGTGTVAIGELDGAEATITQNYETGKGIAQRELNAQNAFMQGKLKISGNMMKIMQLQGVINAIDKATEGVEVEYP